MNRPAGWDLERSQLLGRRIADLGLTISGSRVERLVERLYEELDARGVAYRPAVYLSDQWGCPDGTPLIGIPFYLADEALERIEAEHAGAVESDEEAMRYLRHEAGHAVNYAFRVHEREEFRDVFGDYARPYDDHYPANPLSRSHVRHILGWYAQKHPDEDFAETFAVWLTPDLDWRAEYEGWGALRKLEWVDALMRDLAPRVTDALVPGDDDLPVEAMTWTVADHYARDERLPLGDARQFDRDLRRLFAAGRDAPDGEPADRFLARHDGELTSRIAYWSGSGPAMVRSLLSALAHRAGELDLRVSGLEASTLIELTAFGMAVVMHWRYTSAASERAESEVG